MNMRAMKSLHPFSLQTDVWKHAIELQIYLIINSNSSIGFSLQAFLEF